jgi:NAD(P)-dependent dehydrogenase (short-subunit alcohol dehydrogenase family)
MYPGVAVVTGAAGTGMGAAIARSFADEGCRRIAITDFNVELLERTKESILQKHKTVDVFSMPGDISDEKFVDSFFNAVVERFGRLDYCVNCAGILGNDSTSTNTSVADFDKINNVNYRGCWLSSRAELKHMVEQKPLDSHDGRPGERGSIVNIASQLGLVGRPRAGMSQSQRLLQANSNTSGILRFQVGRHINDTLRCHRLRFAQDSRQRHMSRYH